MPRHSPSWLARAVILLSATLVVAGLSDCVSASTGSSPGGLLLPLLPRTDGPAADRDEVLRLARGTYIERILDERDSVLDRWPDRGERPLRVWIEPSSTAGFRDLVADAFTSWTETGIPLHFEFVARA